MRYVAYVGVFLFLIALPERAQSTEADPFAIEDSSVVSYAATYQNNGDIYVAYPTETPTGLSKRTAGAPADTVVVSDTFMKEYPSIASTGTRIEKMGA